MHSARAIAAAATAAIILAAGAAHAQVGLTAQITGFNGGGSTTVAQPPGETHRLYQAVKTGSIRALRDGSPLAAPVLTLPNVDSSSEGGVLGLAFDPAFQQNGYMYVYYSSLASPAGDRLERYTLDPANPEVVIPNSVLLLLVNARNSGIHHGGWIGFGPDGYLYLSVGNTGNSAYSPSLTVPFGKVLRLDVSADGFPADPLRNYTIPPSNPFAGSATALPEIWAYGLRNPWRCSFDRLTGDFWIGDVGDSTEEEFDFQPALGLPPYTAVNYGYPCMEGSICRGGTGCNCLDGSLTLPVFEYGRSYGFANVGGYVYRGSAIPALRGTFILGDNGGNMYSFRKTPDAITEFRSLGASLNPTHTSLYGFGQDQAGELYYCTATGPIYKIVPACAPNCDGSTAPPILNVADFTCFLQSFASGDPYANCDHSTTPPILNVADFTCFLQSFAGGCP